VLNHLSLKFGALFITVLMAGCSTSSSMVAPSAAVLVGTWKVDLRPLPTSEGYFQEFVVTSAEGKTFTGTFYGTYVTQGRVNTDWGTIRIAFVTADGSGLYNHSAVLVGHKLEGLSNSTGRNFLSYWSATKQP
jgi:hypothetical protein